MAYSYSSQIADGVKRVFSFSFVGSGYGYIRDSDIRVYVDGVQQMVTLPSPNQVQFVTPPAAGKVVLIRRVMPKDAPYSAWNRGNNLTQEMLNNTILQQLYVMHELFDGFAFDNLQISSHINMRDHRITDMRDGISPKDAVTLQQLTSYEASIGAASQTAAASSAAAVAAQVAANSYKDTAVTKANEASASASAASSSASTASTKATAAAASATAAAASATTAGNKADDALQYSNASYNAMLLSAGYKDTAGLSATTANNDANRAEAAAARAEAAAPINGALSVDANLGDLGNREYALDNLGIGTAAAASSDDNLLINPSGSIAQFGPTATTNGGWICDMWSMGGCGGLANSVFTASRAFDLTQYVRGAHSHLTLTYAKAATLNNTHAPNLSLVVPRFYSTPLFGNTFTVSFWVTATKAGTYSVTLRSRNNRICYVHPYTIDSANTWAEVRFTVQGGLPSTSATDTLYWGDGNTASYRLIFCTGFVGSDYITTTPDTWVDAGTSTVLGVAAQSNNQSMLAAGDMLRVTAVKVELGKRDTPFRLRNTMTELVMCQQYYEEVMLTEYGMTSTSLSPPWYKGFTYRLKAGAPTITTKGGASLTNVTAIAYSSITSSWAQVAYTWTPGPNLYAYTLVAVVDARGQLL